MYEVVLGTLPVAEEFGYWLPPSIVKTVGTYQDRLRGGAGFG